MGPGPEFDLAIVGGGLVGLSLAVALQGSGLRLALVEPRLAPPIAPEGWDSRIYALSPGSMAFLERLGVWPELPQDRLTRVEAMEIYGDDGAARLDFSAYDAGLRELAVIVENRFLQQALWRAAQAAVARVCCPAECASLQLGADGARLSLADGAELAVRLVVGADGADSWVRTQAGIAVVPVDYGQLGVVANFSCEKPHRGIAFQWFRRDGVLALLPLPGDRVSMVWSIARESGERLLALPAPDLAAEVAGASHDALGALAVITAPAAFPLRLQRVSRFVKPRIALAGDAAHNVHPLAGQGVNLGFRDARALAAALNGREARYDCGDHALLRRYERARREDVAALQLTTHGLQKLFGVEAVWVARARNAGLNLVNLLPQLKNLLVRQAVA
jgi:ubiquinone biosynthesis UbiH/UbiF/VisC/COQ6 family hydroxylase